MTKSVSHALRNAKRIGYELQALEFNTDAMLQHLPYHIQHAKGTFQWECRQPFLQGDLVKRTHFRILFRQYIRAFGNYYPEGFVATLTHDPVKRRFFDLRQGPVFTAREAFNLLEGRAVFRRNPGEALGGAWYHMDFAGKDGQGNYRLEKHGLPEEGYIFPKSLLALPAQQLTLRQWRTAFLAALRKGDRVATTLEQQGKTRQVYVEMDGRNFELLMKDKTGRRIDLSGKRGTISKTRKPKK